MSVHARCGDTRRQPDRGELHLRLCLTVGDHPMLGLTAARVLMILVDELQADHVPLRHLEIGLEGPLPERIPHR
jgi:hypothetical protein